MMLYMRNRWYRCRDLISIIIIIIMLLYCIVYRLYCGNQWRSFVDSRWTWIRRRIPGGGLLRRS